MFLPKHFTESDATAIAALVRAAGFGHLVVAGGDGLSSTPMPFVIDDELAAVRAHLARPNPIWSMAPCDALLIVPVSDAYISPGWYPSKQVDGKVVPTWNYEVVHLHGRLVSHDDPEWVYAQITELTELNESVLDAPWAVTDAPADYITKLQGSIVGVELEVTRVDAKRKLSQNKSDTDRSGAIEGLANSPLPRSAAVGRAMS